MSEATVYEKAIAEGWAKGYYTKQVVELIVDLTVELTAESRGLCFTRIRLHKDLIEQFNLECD